MSTLLLVAVSNNASVGGLLGMAWKVGAVLRDEVSGTPTRGRCQSTMPTSDSYKAKTVEHRQAKMRPNEWRQRMAVRCESRDLDYIIKEREYKGYSKGRSSL